MAWLPTFVDEPGLTFHLLSRALGVNLLGREGNSQIGDRMQITETRPQIKRLLAIHL